MAEENCLTLTLETELDRLREQSRRLSSALTELERAICVVLTDDKEEPTSEKEDVPFYATPLIRDLASITETLSRSITRLERLNMRIEA